MRAQSGTRWLEDETDCQIYAASRKVTRVAPCTSPLRRAAFQTFTDRRESCKSVRLLSPSPPVRSQIIPPLKIQREESRQVWVVNSSRGAAYKIRLRARVKQPWLCEWQNYALIMSTIKESTLGRSFSSRLDFFFFLIPFRPHSDGSGPHLVCYIRHDLSQSSQTERNRLSLKELLRFLWIKKKKRNEHN